MPVKPRTPNNFDFGHHQIVELPHEEIIAMYDGGQSPAQIAKHFKVGRTTIDRRLNALGVSRRTMSAANQLTADARTLEETARIVAPAHAASRRRKTFPEIAKAAITRQTRGAKIGTGEHRLLGWLEARGLRVTPQKAIGPYNVDLAIHPIAVEVHAARWNPLNGARATKRAVYILNRGWSLIYVWVPRGRVLGEIAADYIASLAQIAQSNPSDIGQYRVIRGSGELAFRGGLNGDHLSAVFAPGRSYNIGTTNDRRT